MQTLLRKVVAGPRARHAEADLDLCYVTDFIIATSGPSATYPQRAYRNPLDQLVAFLDSKHGEDWAIFEFRAEGTGYPDEEVYGRITHFPWPDHHPPPFEVIPNLMAAMRNWVHPQDPAIQNRLQEKEAKGKGGRVAVVHCKAGKGRSGTAACSYLMSEEGWKKEDALTVFTTKRMRPGFGAGVSIPSQVRYLDYVERWIKCGKIYVEQRVEVLEVHIWGLRDGVKVAIEGYVEEDGPWKIKTFHTFHKKERDDLDEQGHQKSVVRTTSHSAAPSRTSSVRSLAETKARSSVESLTSHLAHRPEPSFSPSMYPAHPLSNLENNTNVIYSPSSPVILPTNDINLAIERRNGASLGWTMVTSVAHVWFNTFFEGCGPEKYQEAKRKHSPSATTSPDDIAGAPWADNAGVFEIQFDAMDGIKGSSRKGTRAFDKVAVVWRVKATVPVEKTKQFMYKQESHVADEQARGRPREPSVVITEPTPNEPVHGGIAADWHATEHHEMGHRDQASAPRKDGGAGMGHKLGPRVASQSASRDPSVNRAASTSEENLVHKLKRGGYSAGFEDSGSDEEGVDGIARGIVESG